MLLVAHRTPGTAVACTALAAAGVTLFEADVQLRRGGTVVVSHYLPFLRIHGWVQHDNRRFRWRYGPPFDPTLPEVLGRIPAHCRVLLDPKETDPGRRRDLVDALAAVTDRARFVVSTDHDVDLERYRDAGFSTWRTIKSMADLDRAVAGGRLSDDGASVRHTLLDHVVVERLHTVTDTIVAWTVNDAERAVALRRFGVDGITTDRAQVLKSVGVQSPGAL